jgi:hypothetical protein
VSGYDRAVMHEAKLHAQCHRDISQLLTEVQRLRNAIREHHDKMTALGSGGGDQDRKLWQALEYRTALIDGSESTGP